MGFMIIDDYWEAARDMSRAEQDKFLGALCRRYFEQTEEADSLPKAAKTAYKSVRSRIDGARADTERKRAKKAGQSADNPETIPGQSAEPLIIVEQSKVKGRYRVATPTSETPPSPMRGGESRDGGNNPGHRDVGHPEPLGPLDPSEVDALIAAAREALS